MAFCNCDDKVKNFGQPDCVGILERPDRLMFVQRRANDGTLNKILAADVLDDTYVTNKINNDDLSVRWFPSPTINNVDDTRAENNTFEIEDFNVNTSLGVRMINCTIIDGASPELASALQSLVCRDFSFYSISITNQIGGNGKNAGELLPFRIKKNTMMVIYNPPNKQNETPAMIMLSFALHESEHDEDIAFINFGTDTGDVQVDLHDYDGLVDVSLTNPTGISATGVTIDAEMIYGAKFDKNPVEGLALADFSLFNETDAASVTPTSVTESSTVPGRYAFVIPSQDSSDVMRISLDKNGFEMLAPLNYTVT